jgi:plasmid maintenance system antidote protein VapI
MTVRQNAFLHASVFSGSYVTGFDGGWPGRRINRVTGIINGQRAITADTALRLGHWFGTSPEFWLNLQKLYELRLAREEVGDRVDRLPRLTQRRRPRARHAA